MNRFLSRPRPILPLPIAACGWKMTLTIVRLSTTPRGSLAPKARVEGPIAAPGRSNRFRGMSQVATREFRFVPRRARQILRVTGLCFQLGGVCRHHPVPFESACHNKYTVHPQRVAISELLPHDYRDASISSAHRKFARCRSLVHPSRLTARVPAPRHVPGPKILVSLQQSPALFHEASNSLSSTQI